MEKDKEIQCHNCEEITIINDQYGDIDQEKLKFCPYCGSSDIDIEE